MNRKEALTQLKERIENQGIIRHYYKRIDNDKPCYCAVGHLMEVCGAKTDDIMEGGDGSTEYIKMSISALGRNKPEVVAPMTDLFTEDELQEFQMLNDDNQEEQLLDLIDQMIEAEA